MYVARRFRGDTSQQHPGNDQTDCDRRDDAEHPVPDRILLRRTRRGLRHLRRPDTDQHGRLAQALRLAVELLDRQEIAGRRDGCTDRDVAGRLRENELAEDRLILARKLKLMNLAEVLALGLLVAPR